MYIVFPLAHILLKLSNQTWKTWSGILKFQLILHMYMIVCAIHDNVPLKDLSHGVVNELFWLSTNLTIEGNLKIILCKDRKTPIERNELLIKNIYREQVWIRMEKIDMDYKQQKLMN